MSTENESLVTEFCNALGSGNMDTVVSLSVRGRVLS